MNAEVSKSRFKAHALEIFRHIEQTGEPTIVTDRGVPSLIIRKFSGSRASALDRLRGSVVRYSNPLDPLESEEWEGLR